MRPLTKDGKWQHKTEKEYLCFRNGEEQGFTAAEFKSAQSEGWEKQYQYKVGKKKVYMPSSQAEAQGCERISKYPKSTKYGRQNPISERWNSEEKKYTVDLDMALAQYAELQQQAADMDTTELDTARHAIRPVKSLFNIF